MRPQALISRISLVLWASFVAGVYQDEAFRIDYQHTLLGRPDPENTFFRQASSNSRATLLYMLSERNVLGAINPKDGSLVWRQNLAGNMQDGQRAYLRSSSGSNSVVTSTGGVVQSWDTADGRLLWLHEDIGQTRGLVVPDITGQPQDPIVLLETEGHTKLMRLDSATGKAVWKLEDDTGDTPLAVTSSASGVHFISLQSAVLKASKLKVTSVHLENAKIRGTQLLNLDGDTGSDISLLHVGSKTTAPVLVWSDKSFKALKINVIGSGNIETIKLTSKPPVETIRVHSPTSTTEANHFLIHYQTVDSHWAEVFHVDPKSLKVKKAYELPVVPGKGAFSVNTLGENVLFTRTTARESSLLSSTSQSVIQKWPMRRISTRSITNASNYSSTVTEVVPKGQSGYAVRSAVALASGDVELFRNGEREWIRHESLAGITKAAFANIPVTEDLAERLAVESDSNILSAFTQRLRRHLDDLLCFPEWMRRVPNRIAASLLGREINREGDISDSFGFRKIVVATTENGRVAALDTGNHGSVLWNIEAVRKAPGTRWNVTEISVENNVVLVMAKGGEFILIETVTGRIIQYREPGLIGDIERLLSFSKGNGERTLVPIMGDGTPGSIPSGEFDNRTFIVTQRLDGTVAGWHVQDGTPPANTWIFTPPEGHNISAVTTRAPHDPIASIGKALGDRNVLYKYISKNLLVIVTTNTATDVASIYLLDAVTGEILHSTSHQSVDLSHPISVALSENWLAYTLRTDPVLASGIATPNVPKANLLTISELFESSTVNDRGPVGSVANYSSFFTPPHPPYVITASYIVASPLSHLTISSTKQGITPRSIIAYAAPLSALVAIPVSFLSPRRPVGRDATSGEKEEGLFPYHPLLELNPQWIISHKRDIRGIQTIITSPTLMESSSLVFAHGELDIFGTRIAPIGTFDLLGRGFNKASLVITVSALAIVTRMLAPLARKKQINGLWGQ